MNEIHTQVKQAQREIKEIQDRIHKLLKGRTVRIISNYNGQPLGSSRKSWKGREGKIKEAHVNGRDCVVWLDINGYSEPGLYLHELEFLE